MPIKTVMLVMNKVIIIFIIEANCCVGQYLKLSQNALGLIFDIKEHCQHSLVGVSSKPGKDSKDNKYQCMSWDTMCLL